MNHINRIIFLCVLISGALSSANIVAQSNNLWRDIDHLKYTRVWTNSNNAAGLKAISIDDNISDVSVYANKIDGDFINYYQADNALTFGVDAESFYRLNSNVIFYGKVSYLNFEGKNMGGSVFINPYENPFDIVEYADTTRGSKILESYNLTGAISVKTGNKITLGGKIDYTAAHYAKIKDLRHRNNLLDMNLSAGAIYSINPNVEVGMNYYYKRRIEDVFFKIYGNTDRQYSSIISYGLFWGEMETQTGSYSNISFTNRNNPTPLTNETHGISLQGNINLSQQLSLFNELSYRKRTGYYGIEGNDIKQTEHDANRYEYLGIVTFDKKETLHSFRLSFNHESLSNYKMIFSESTEPGQSSKIIYHTRNQRLSSKTTNAAIQYTSHWGVKEQLPQWELTVGADYCNRRQTSMLYPFYRQQTLHIYKVKTTAVRNIKRTKDLFSLALGAMYGSGNGDVLKTGTYVVPSENQKTPSNADRYLYREYEYQTASHVGGDLGFRYSRILDKLPVRLYTQANFNYIHAFNTEYVGNSNRNITLAIGCVF